jgi:pyruvate dehydrogenase E1 component alpha subunit
MSDPAKYRTREEVDDVREHNDPIKRCEMRLADIGFKDEAALKKIDDEIKKTVKAAADFSLESPEPAPDDLYTDVLA